MAGFGHHHPPLNPQIFQLQVALKSKTNMTDSLSFFNSHRVWTQVITKTQKPLKITNIYCYRYKTNQRMIAGKKLNNEWLTTAEKKQMTKWPTTTQQA